MPSNEPCVGAVVVVSKLTVAFVEGVIVAAELLYAISSVVAVLPPPPEAVTVAVVADVILPLLSTVITGIAVLLPYVVAVTPEVGNTVDEIVPVTLAPVRFVRFAPLIAGRLPIVGFG